MDKEYYNLIIEDDIEPNLVGPFGSWDRMISDAEHHRDNDPDKRDGIYHVTIPKGSFVVIRTYLGKQ